MSKVISKDIKIAFTVISFNLIKPNVPLWTAARSQNKTFGPVKSLIGGVCPLLCDMCRRTANFSAKFQSICN